MNFNESKFEKRFKTKEQAKEVQKSLKRKFPDTEVTLRKSLPEFKNHLCKDYSLWINPFSFAQKIEILNFIKEN